MWYLTGTDNQKMIVREAFARIHFPFGRLKLPGTPELGWRDLNTNYYAALLQRPRHHGGAHDNLPPEAKDIPEPIFHGENNRRWVMGVFYPYSARIYIDVRCEQRPELAWAVISAEIAHAVDEFLPLTDQQRHQFMLELHEGHVDEHTWWERYDYGREYFELVGETFMILFTKAYSDIPFGSADSFVHTGHNMSASRIREIIGIPRTDVPAPSPEPAPAPPSPAPVPEPTPAPSTPDEPPAEPEPDLSGLKHFPGGKDIYHKLGHYGLSRGVPLTTLEGFVPCKVCKPRPTWKVPHDHSDHTH